MVDSDEIVTDVKDIIVSNGAEDFVVGVAVLGDGDQGETETDDDADDSEEEDEGEDNDKGFVAVFHWEKVKGK